MQEQTYCSYLSTIRSFHYFKTGSTLWDTNLNSFGVDGMDGILTVENFDTKLAEDVMLLTPFAADAKDRQFRTCKDLQRKI